MFNGKSSEGARGGETLTLIGPETSFHGVLTVKGSLRVEGMVEGDITDASSVQIGKGGRVKGNIASEVLSIAGQIEGDVVASRNIELLAGGRMTGRIRTPKLRIEEGSFFEGQCSMGENVTVAGEIAAETAETAEHAQVNRG